MIPKRQIPILNEKIMASKKFQNMYKIDLIATWNYLLKNSSLTVSKIKEISISYHHSVNILQVPISTYQCSFSPEELHKVADKLS